jgi:hypothetical protein
MRETELREILRRALQASLALGTACGSGAGSSAAHDASGEDVASSADASTDAPSNGEASSDVTAPDAGDPCHPAGFNPPASCATALIPASCFDASLLGADASISSAMCSSWCGASGIGTFCDVVKSDGDVALACYTAACSNGRKPPGLARGRSRGPLLGRYFADVARAEAASVDAFEILQGELGALGAPRRLLREAARAREDEERHARLTTALAHDHGGRPTRPRVRRSAPRALEVVATENAIEGCVRETFGAAVAMHQATAADDPRVRAIMSSIADDEVRHAALGWAVAEWMDLRLSRSARDRVRDARRDAVRSLRSELDRDVPLELARKAGVPGRPVALCLLDALTTALWSSSTVR